MRSWRPDVTAAVVSIVVFVAIMAAVARSSSGGVTSRGRLEHPMHLHGGAFQILARDGQPVAGQLVKDTVVVEPGESIAIGFRADNPGWWMLHCHELHHAAGSMDTLLYYSGIGRLANLGGSYGNSPE